MRPRLAIIALGAANRRSIARALERAGGDPIFVEEPRGVQDADGVIVPGVANVGYLAAEFDRRKLRAPVLAAIDAGKPCLGICAGFQLMFERSDESPEALGLGIFPGAVQRLRARKSPHLGWNLVEPNDPNFPGGWAYFAHSYAAPADVPDATAVTNYGNYFASVGSRGRTIGVQFHPERSGRYGACFLERFVSLARACHAG
ncbi:MAG TPA: imidazole glycerol phosphate synthase subunit HisH [Candidatus Cybelea sp.]